MLERRVSLLPRGRSSRRRLKGVRGALVAALFLAPAACRDDDPKQPKKTAIEPVASSEPAPPVDSIPELASGPNRFRVEGAENGVIVGAAASFSRSADGGLRQLEIATKPEYRRKHKRSYVAHLYFPAGFRPKPGTYPIAADYRKRSDALGASLVVHDDRLKLFGFDAKGEVTFTGAGEQTLAGRFHYSVMDAGRGAKDPKTVSVSGQFEATAAVPPPKKK